jgi:hypothetical protein
MKMAFVFVKSVALSEGLHRLGTYRVQTIDKVGRVRVQSTEYSTVVNAGKKNSSVATLGLISIPRDQRRAWALDRDGESEKERRDFDEAARLGLARRRGIAKGSSGRPD